MYCLLIVLCNLIEYIRAAANLQIVYRIEIVQLDRYNYSTYAKLTKVDAKLLQVGGWSRFKVRIGFFFQEGVQYLDRTEGYPCRLVTDTQ